MCTNNYSLTLGLILMGSMVSMDSLTLLLLVTTGIATEDDSRSVWELGPVLGSEGVGVGLMDAKREREGTGG